MSKFMFTDDQTEFLKEAFTEVERKAPEGHFALYLLKCMLGLNPGEITPAVIDWANNAVESSGNVFADLGLSNPEEHFRKAGIAAEIQRKLSDGDVDISLITEQSGLPVESILKGHFSDIDESKLIGLNESL